MLYCNYMAKYTSYYNCFSISGMLLSILRFLNIKSLCVSPRSFMLVAGCLIPAFVVPLIDIIQDIQLNIYHLYMIFQFGNDNYIYLSKTIFKNLKINFFVIGQENNALVDMAHS